MKFKYLSYGLIILVIMGLFTIGCSGSSNKNPTGIDELELPPPCNEGPIDGEVIVAFSEDTSRIEAEEFMMNFDIPKIKWSYSSLRIEVWVKVDHGNIQNHLETLGTNPVISWVGEREYSFEDRDFSKQYLLVKFSYENTSADISEYIETIDGLVLARINQPSLIWVLVQTPIGNENHWIETFLSYEIVRFAEQNQRGCLD